MASNIVDLDEYNRLTYGTQTMPESKQKFINNLCRLLLVLDLLLLILWLVGRFLPFLTDLQFYKIFYYTSGILASILFIWIKITFFIYYFVKWYARLHQSWFLRISQILGGIITTITILILFSFFAKMVSGFGTTVFLYISAGIPIAIICVYTILVPHLQHKRQILINVSAKTPVEPNVHIINYPDPDRTSLNVNNANSSSSTLATSTISTHTIIQSTTNRPILFDTQQELKAAFAILFGAIMCDIWAIYVTNMLVSATQSDSSAVRGMTGLVGLCFCAPLIGGVILVCMAARSRLRFIQSHNKQKQCEAATTVNIIAIILALLSTLAFIIIALAFITMFSS